ncbi:MAG: hypothetical protein HPY30_09175 [Gammaproteobacteria bacterium (ex Lamellibrachia satsuma)]|nr:MAG: hypothetical protein HPY30_09175 [Gammaproteobacteria bacterium (ex Lamellibrachia satsuma)]
MHETLLKLYRDHVHFFKLMDIFEAELDRLKQGGMTSVDLITEVANYMRDYSDTIHHPIEDHLYQINLARTDDGREALEQLLVHHQAIMNMTREFRLAIEQLGKPDGLSIEEVEKLGRDYLDHQRSHMTFEEEKAFPLLAEQLGSDDFDYASGALPADQDPLLAPGLQERYPALHSHLQKHG